MKFLTLALAGYFAHSAAIPVSSIGAGLIRRQGGGVSQSSGNSTGYGNGTINAVTAGNSTRGFTAGSDIGGGGPVGTGGRSTMGTGSSGTGGSIMSLFSGPKSFNTPYSLNAGGAAAQTHGALPEVGTSVPSQTAGTPGPPGPIAGLRGGTTGPAGPITGPTGGATGQIGGAIGPGGSGSIPQPEGGSSQQGAGGSVPQLGGGNIQPSTNGGGQQGGSSGGGRLPQLGRNEGVNPASS